MSSGNRDVSAFPFYTLFFGFLFVFLQPRLTKAFFFSDFDRVDSHICTLAAILSAGSGSLESGIQSRWTSWRSCCHLSGPTSSSLGRLPLRERRQPWSWTQFRRCSINRRWISGRRHPYAGTRRNLMRWHLLVIVFHQVVLVRGDYRSNPVISLSMVLLSTQVIATMRMFWAARAENAVQWCVRFSRKQLGQYIFERNRVTSRNP